MKDVKTLSDEALVDLVRNQDQELYAELVRRYQDKLLRYATYLVKDEAHASDVVQQAFIKAFINLHGFNIKKKFSSWLYRIVHNEAINYLKNYQKEISLEKNHWLEEKISSQENVEKNFTKKEIQEMVNLCLKKLPLIYRSPLILFYLDGRSYEEISDILRIPLGTVATRINRGKKLALTILKSFDTAQDEGGQDYGQN